MANMSAKHTRAAAVFMAAGFGLLMLCAFPGGASAQGKPEDQGPNVRSTKEPGQTCEQYKKDSPAYKDCVEAAAKSYQPEGGQMGTGMGKGQGMGPGEGMGPEGMEHGKSMDKGMGDGMGPGEGMGPEGMEHGKSMDKGMGDGMGGGEGMGGGDGMGGGGGTGKGKGKNR